MMLDKANNITTVNFHSVKSFPAGQFFLADLLDPSCRQNKKVTMFLKFCSNVFKKPMLIDVPGTFDDICDVIYEKGLYC